MRNDFDKILCERPRHNSRDPLHASTRRQERKVYRRSTNDPTAEAWEYLPTKQSMKQRVLYGARREGKELNEYLKPLKRYLEAQVGRRWDEVYSEICANMDRRSAVGLHIFQHLFDFVLVYGKSYRVGIDSDGDLVAIAYSGGMKKIKEQVNGQLYVNPKTDVIMMTPLRRKKETKAPTSATKLDNGQDTVYWHDENNVWYRVTYRQMTAREARQSLFLDGRLDMAIFGNQHSWLASAPYKHVICKVQIGSREKKKLGLP